jgi:hypothetical protein
MVCSLALSACETVTASKATTGKAELSRLCETIQFNSVLPAVLVMFNLVERQFPNRILISGCTFKQTECHNYKLYKVAKLSKGRFSFDSAILGFRKTPVR